MVNEIFAETKTAMQKAIEALQHDLATLRTGRASANLLDSLRVEYYGSQVPINQVANVGVPEPQLLVIQPWDKSVIPQIEKAIQASSLGLTPNNDGEIIRLPIPQLTEERRLELVRVIRAKGEETRVSIRGARRDANDLLKEAQKEGELPEDEAYRGQDQVQELTNEFVAKAEDVLDEKEAEIMQI